MRPPLESSQWFLTHGFPAEGSCLDNKCDSAAVNCQGNNLWQYLGPAKQHKQPAGMKATPKKLQVKRVKSYTRVCGKPRRLCTCPPQKAEYNYSTQRKKKILNNLAKEIILSQHDRNPQNMTVHSISMVCTQHPLFTLSPSFGGYHWCNVGGSSLVAHVEFAFHFLMKRGTCVSFQF